MHPASMAQTIKCGACLTSALRCAVPRMNAGTLQRARKTPHTMIRETVIGEISGLTSLIGASAPPSQAPAANPQNIPKACRLRRRAAYSGAFTAVDCALEGEFNEAYPGGKLLPRERKEESRNECRLQSRGRCCAGD